MALIRAAIDEVKDVAHAHGAKVNDVLLTAIAGGLRALLGCLGSCPSRHAFGLLSDRINSLPVTADPVEDLVPAAVLGFRAFVLEHPDLFRLVSSWELVCSSVHRLRRRRRPR